jgi:hypothetical protein
VSESDFTVVTAVMQFHKFQFKFGRVVSGAWRSPTPRTDVGAVSVPECRMCGGRSRASPPPPLEISSRAGESWASCESGAVNFKTELCECETSRKSQELVV